MNIDIVVVGVIVGAIVRADAVLTVLARLIARARGLPDWDRKRAQKIVAGIQHDEAIGKLVVNSDRLIELAQELKPNGGASFRDEVNRNFAAVQAQIGGLDRKLAADFTWQREHEQQHARAGDGSLESRLARERPEGWGTGEGAQV